MKLHPVVICSNKVNRYGFRVLASGVELSMYAKNPIVLYAHQRPNITNPFVTPVGKMHNIKLNESSELVGEIEFDQDDEFAVRLEKKWEKGMLNAVSLKAEMVEVSDGPEYLLPGQEYPTLIKSLLEEVSIEPIPGDSDAVALRLHYKGQEPTIISLSDDSNPDLTKLFPNINHKSTSDMKIIQLAFKGQKYVTLSANASEEDIANAVTDLVNKFNEIESEKVQLSADIKTKSDKVTELETKISTIELSAKDEKANALVDNAITARKILPADKAEYVELAKTNYDTVKNILDKKKGFTSVADALAGKAGEAAADTAKYAELSYKELDKKGLLPGLKAADEELFKSKFKEQYGTDYKG